MTTIGTDIPLAPPLAPLCSRATPKSRRAAKLPVPPAFRPTVSLVLPAYNEAAIVHHSLSILCEYMRSLEHKYQWEIVVINDGSRDDTSDRARQFASGRSNVYVFDHAVNFGLGQALKFAFNQCRGEVIVVLDMDLSYSPDHIERLVDTLRQTRAKLVLASPYLSGGAVRNVPLLRRWLSVGANKFLSFAAHGRVKTLTGMVRAYDAKFLRSLDFYSMGMEVNSEILYKAMVLRARVVEIPATLQWNTPGNTLGNTPDAASTPAVKTARKSSMRIARQILMLLVSGYLYRPIVFFVLPALLALGVAGWCGAWAMIDAQQAGGLSAAWRAWPAPFCVGGLSLLAAVQLFGCGLVSLQNKCYFEQMFHLGTTTLRASRQGKKENV